jgi:hypothetical protein
MSLIFGEYYKFSPAVLKSMTDFQSPMTQQLIHLYGHFWDQYLKMSMELRKNNALPYLLAPSQNYENADVKILICGKESMDWGHGDGEFNDDNTNVEGLMRLYDFWINGNGGTTTDNGSYGAFMKFYAEWFKYWFEDHAIFEDEILSKKIRTTHKTIGCIAANFIKISHRGIGYDSGLNEPFYNIFEEEIKILNPDIVVATIYNQKEISYRDIMDKALGLTTMNFKFNGNIEYRKFSVGSRYFYLMRHPQCMSNRLKKLVWNDIRATISNELI